LTRLISLGIYRAAYVGMILFAATYGVANCVSALLDAPTRPVYWHWPELVRGLVLLGLLGPLVYLLRHPNWWKFQGGAGEG
jgi:hypothetical protein